MERPEFLRIHSKYLSEEFGTKYKLNSIIDQDGHIYCQINKTECMA